MKQIYDIAIVGAGIVGLATAYQILKRDSTLRVVIIEKELEVAAHQSGHNSNVIHSGVYYEPGSPKAINCIKGYNLLLEFCQTQHINHDICGKLIIAKSEDEIPVLRKIYHRGVQNGLTGLQILDQQEIKKREPKISSIEAIWVPQAGIVSYPEVCRVLVHLIQELGGHIFLGNKVSELKRVDGSLNIHAGGIIFKSKIFLNCAGLYADKIAIMTGMRPAFKILPFRGEYYSLSEEKARHIKHLIYPVPDMRFPFLGVHLTPTMAGGVEAGPNAVLAFRREGYKNLDIHPRELAEALFYPGFLRLASKYFFKGIDEMRKSFSRQAFFKAVKPLYPELQIGDLRRSGAGVRAQAIDAAGNLLYDYGILEDEQIINVCNAPSPAATSCLAIGDFLGHKALHKLSTE